MINYVRVKLMYMPNSSRLGLYVLADNETGMNIFRWIVLGFAVIYGYVNSEDITYLEMSEPQGKYNYELPEF